MKKSFFVVLLVLISSEWLGAQVPTIGGCQVFPADNPWNQDISKYPVHPKSDVFVAAINKTKQFLHADFGTPAEYGIPFILVDSTQPFVPITYNAYGNESDPGPFPFPADAPVENGSASSGDRHVIVIDKSNCTLYELYNARKDAAGPGWTANSGAVYDLSKSEYRPDGWTSADAAGLPIFPGLARYEEVAAGAINHALRYTVDNSQRGWIHPARHQAGKNDTTYPPMGLRLRLKANYDISKVTGQSKIILQALKKYGMINADNGSSWFISGTSDPSWDDNDLNQLKKIPGSAFEAVYTGPIKTSPSTMSVTLPRAGDMISGGTLNYLVKCTTANVDSLRSLEFSSDGGTHWSVMAGVTGTNSFTWSTVPDVATTNAKIRVSDELGTTAVSGIFTITSKASSSISNVQVKNVVNSHIGTGIATTISWITTGNVPGPIAAEYSTDNSKWTSINSSIPTSTTSIPWTTPSAAPMMYVRVRSTSDGKIAGTFGPFVIDPAKGVSDVPKNSLSLSVFPNPVSGRTEIRFSISDQEFVSLKIYSSTGIEIASLLSGRIQSAGEHAIAFEARGLSDGVYFCRMFAGGESIAIKMVVAR